MKLFNLWTWLRAGYLVLELLVSPKSNIFYTNVPFEQFAVINETFEDTALRKLMREAKASLIDIGRACIAGALLRYFEDNSNSSSNHNLHSNHRHNHNNNNNTNNNSNNNNNDSDSDSNSNALEGGRFLESFDLSENKTVMTDNGIGLIDGNYNYRDITIDGVPIFKELIGYSSIRLAIGDDITSPRARLIEIAHPNDSIFDQNKYDEYRIAWWINVLFKILSFVLPDLLCKRIMRSLISHHCLEICYLSFDNNELMIGNEPCEEFRIVKTNMNTACLCISTYSGDISLNFTYNPNCITNPQRLIQGFLAEMEELQAMYHPH